jgi:HTH-type transcriptional regulator/antitoxin HipB
MHFPVATSAQLRAILLALRKSRALSQTDVGRLLGVNQKRVARIESAPGKTSFDQIARLVSSLGGRLVIEDLQAPTATPPARSPAVRTSHKAAGNW